ncbi:hypothetical protein ACFSR2_18940 [Emticicia soli]|uniref:Uncharacterized protein n=1 Tax=Emticicia soli TaxID=2027878 RepID=A0ABW5JEI9_9BACT
MPAIVTPYAWFCAIGSGLRILPLLILTNRLFQRQAQGRKLTHKNQ